MKTKEEQSRPSFMDKFSSRLISQLIGFESFENTLKNDVMETLCASTSKTSSSRSMSRSSPKNKYNNSSRSRSHNKKRERNQIDPLTSTSTSTSTSMFSPAARNNTDIGMMRTSSNSYNKIPFYWRTKCSDCTTSSSTTTTNNNSNNTSNHNKGHVFFLDVTVDFIKTNQQNSQESIINNEKEVPVILNNNEYRSCCPRIETRFGALIQRSKNILQASNLDNKYNHNVKDGGAHSAGVVDGGAMYVQSDIFTKEMLLDYAKDISIDLDDTGPIEMANTFAKALLTTSTHTSTCTPRSHNNDMLKLMTVIIDRNDMFTVTKDRIGIYHNDFMEEGYIHFPVLSNHDNSSSSSSSSSRYIGQFALQMIVSNFMRSDYEEEQSCRVNDLEKGGNGVEGLLQNEHTDAFNNKMTKNISDQIIAIDDTDKDALSLWWEYQQNEQNTKFVMNTEEGKTVDDDDCHCIPTSKKSKQSDKVEQQKVDHQNDNHNNIIVRKIELKEEKLVPDKVNTLLITSTKNQIEVNGNREKDTTTALKQQQPQKIVHGHAMLRSNIRIKKKKKGKMVIGKRM